MTQAEIDIISSMYGPACPVAAAALAASEAARVAAFNASVKKKKPVLCCRRCGGKGYLPSFQHIKAGECFTCHGTGEAK